MNPIVVQFRTLRALIVRELMMRYGREGGGFLWVIIEPMLLCVGITTIWMLMKPGYEKGILVSALVFTGYMPLTLWRHLTNPAVHILRHNRQLFYHRYVSTLDIFFSRQLLEFVATSTAFLVVYLALLALGFVAPIYDWSIVLMAWLLMAYFSIAASLMFCVITEVYEWADKLVQPFQYLLIPISGVFFILDWLPTYARDIMLWNPLVHIYELTRAGFIGPELTAFGDPVYPLVWATLTLALGSIGVFAARKKVFV